METRQLGNNGPLLSVIGFGAWAIGGPWKFGWGEVDDDESIAAIHRALDLGVTWIDTAAAYGFGHSETVVGKALRGMANKPFVATKCGLLPDGKGGARNSIAPASIRAEAEESLRRLNTDCIDLYQIHWPATDATVEEAWSTMVALQKEGKARYIGVSNFDVTMLERCTAIGPVQSLQPPYSLIARQVEIETLAFCKARGIGVVVYSPMQSGLLTGRFDRSRLAHDDWRQRISIFQEPELSKILGFVDDLRPIAEKHGKSVGELAVAWVLRTKAVTSAIVGARLASQIEGTVGAAGWTLTDHEISTIEKLHHDRF